MSTERADKKARRSLSKVLPTGTSVRAYATGRANARMTQLAIGILVSFGVLFLLVAILADRIMFPGVLILLFFVSSIKPFRGCAVTETGVLLLKTRVSNHQPDKVIVEVPYAALFAPNPMPAGKRAIRVSLGPDIVRFRVVDYERLIASVTSAERELHSGVAQISFYGPSAVAGPSSATVAPGWYPVGGNPYHQAYWDGHSWSQPQHWNGASWVPADPASI
jgi:hypothetical protein